MLTDSQISTLKNELVNLKNELEKTNDEADRKYNVRETTGELSLYDNHPGDMGTELFEREKDSALSIHSFSQLDKVNEALNAIDKESYGKCIECGKEIPFERLEAVPYTTYCVEHADQILPDDRPVEEEILEPPLDNTFSGRHRGSNREYEDTFQVVAQYGTSETPSDFEGDYQDYNQLYNEELKDGFTEEYETFSATDIEGKNLHVIQSEGEKEYTEKLDEAGLESPIGDIPYKMSDGYVNKDEDENGDKIK